MFDRWAERRESAEELLADERRLVLVSDGRTFALRGNSLALVDGYAIELKEWVLLGRYDDAPLFLAIDDPAALADPALELTDFRKAALRLNANETEILMYAQALLNWIARTRFCSLCSGPLESRRGGHLRVCSLCGTEFYPRLDPAVIMLVTHGERALLAQHQGRATAFWSTIAGFVEAGETLEQAVARETMEETGLVATSIDYYGSQPWPLPSSLMLAFRVRVAAGEIRIDPSELQDARWFTRDEVRSGELTLSGPISISRWLIDAWLNEAGS
jgi:NAD+ diphosphatase